MFLHESFEHQAALRPFAVALTCGQRHLTYGELDALANEYAHKLIAAGVVAETRVGLYLPPGIELIAAMLGVMKSGGAWVPLDPAQPGRRLTRMLATAEPAVIVTRRSTAGSLPAHDARLVFADSDMPGAGNGHAPRIGAVADGLCYVMFTSGSTGAPKGVMVTHGNLEPLFAEISGLLAIEPGDVWTWFHPVSFGFSVWEIWGALCHGGRLVIVPPDLRTNPAGLYRLVRDQQVTILSQTPSAFRQNLLAEPFVAGTDQTALRCIVLSGEAVDATALQAWFARHPPGEPRIVNTYAITETAGQLTWRELDARDVDRQRAGNVGRALAHAEFAIVADLSADGPARLAPPGEPGELFVGGASIARGYLGDAPQTAEKFLAVRFDGCRAERWYRTGDRARLTRQGALEFLGRTDDQVKLRGYRIEPGEIAAVLREHPAIEDAAVTLTGEDGGQPRLAAYIVRRAAPASRPEFWPAVGPYQLYDEFLYDLMSAEGERLSSYRQAFERSVRNRVVLDIGTGEHALLARLCIEAGARRVYAVEVLADACQKARALVAELGLSDRIRVLDGDVATLELPEPVEVCTQGIIGNIGSADGIIPIWNDARRLFAPGCVPVPLRCRSMIAAVELPDALRAQPAFSPVAAGYANKVFAQQGRRFDIRLCVSDLPESAIISDAHVFEDLDFTGRLAETTHGSASLRLQRDGRLDGYLVWTVVTTGGETTVDYRRTQRAWLPVFIPLGDTGDDGGRPVTRQDAIDLDWRIAAEASIHPYYRIGTTVQSPNGACATYQYVSRVNETRLNGNALYRALWRDGSADRSVQPANHKAIRAWLAERLPDYMVPTAWVELDQLPLNQNHKLDRAALPPPVPDPGDGKPLTAPRDPLERDLADLWQKALNRADFGIHDNFFDLGGDSIAAVGLTSAMQRLLDDAVMLVALFDAPTIADLGQYLRSHHAAAVNGRYATAAPAVLPERDIGSESGGDAPLSFQQQSFWILNQLYPAMTGSNEQFVIPLDGPVDAGRLESAWNVVLERHEVLRTVFRDSDAGVRQVVLPHTTVALPVMDLSATAGAEERFLEVARQSIMRRYSLTAGPLIVAGLYRLTPQHAKLLVNAHHIIADGLSIRVIRDELAALYGSAASDRRHVLPPPAMQYREYSMRQLAESRGDSWDRGLEFWRTRLLDAPERTALPARAMTFADADWTGAQRRVGFVIDAETAEGLRALSRGAGVTLYMTMLAAFRALIMRYSGQDDIVIGSPVTSREPASGRAMVGCFVNNVALRNSVDAEEPFVDLLSRERSVVLSALQHADVPFERVVEMLRPRRHFGEHPIFQLLFLFEDAYERQRHAGEISFGLETLNTHRSAYWDLEFSVADYGADGEIRGYLGYSNTRFYAEFAEAIPAHYLQLLRGIVEHPQRAVSAQPLMTGQDRRAMLCDWNATPVEWPGPVTLHERFRRQCERSPDAVALIGDDWTLSYRELDARVALLTAALQSRGIGAGDLVGIGVGRSAELVIAMIATLNTGAAYVPLDPTYPPLRLQHMVAQTRVRTILTDARLPRSVTGTLDTLRLDEFDWAAGFTPPAVDPVPAERACVLYTSGSTGVPKGAINLHAGAVNRCEWMWREYDFTTRDVFCLRSSPNFVDSIWEIFGPLTHGAALRIFSDDDVADPVRLVDQLAQRRAGRMVTHLVVVPSLLSAMLDTDARLGRRLPTLRTWITSGEPLRPDLVRRFRRACSGATLLNTYGTSETWDVTCFDTAEWQPDESIVPIGPPIAGVRAYVLDAHRQPLPVGVVGELYVGGVGVGGGYLDRPELNTDRFLPDPFADRPDRRLYRTGDLARYRPDGRLECLGRVDRQIKLRGFRIEPDEIATALRDHPGVRDACVDLRGKPDGDPALTAYWLPAADTEQVPPQALRDFLRSRLPSFMLPGLFVELTDWPLTPSGKIDLRALPDPGAPSNGTPVDAAPYVAPGSETERKVARLWCEVLGVERAGVQDDFFDSGGHSLSATRFLARLREQFEFSPSLADFFETPNIAALAGLIDTATQEMSAQEPAHPAGPEPQQRSGRVPLSFAQERLWFLNELDPDCPAYNIAFTIHLSAAPDRSALQSAVDQLIHRHEILRTRFATHDGRPYQEILPAQTVPIECESLVGRNAREWEDRLATLAARPFHLSRGPLLRLHLIEGDADRHLLLVVVHHIVSDGLSNAIFFAELATLYDSAIRHRAGDLPELPLQYADYAEWQRKHADRPALTRQLRYWTEQLDDAPPALMLPTDRPRPAEQMFRGAWLWREIPAARAERLRAFGRKNRCTLYMVLLGAFNVLLNRYSGQTDLVVGSPIAGRSWRKLDDLIGLFVNTVALRIDLSGQPTFAELLARVRQVTLDSQDNQDLPFEQLVEALRPDRTLSHAPVFQVMFNMTPIPELQRRSGGLHMQLGRLQDHGVSTFDLTLNVGESADGLDLVFEYDRDLFDRETIARFAAQFDCLLGVIIDSAATRIDALPIETAEQRARWLAMLNPPRAADCGDELTVMARFEQQVHQHPELIALESDGQTWTYAELDHRAARIATRLIELGVEPGTFVAVCLERNRELFSAVLGVLKAGCAYVPFDPTHPAARLSDMCDIIRPGALVSRRDLVRQLPLASVPAVLIDEDLPDHVARDELRQRAAGLTAPAYALFTSGSTGTPKAVAVTHANLASIARAWQGAYSLTASDRHLQMANFSFDVFTGDWVRALCSGGTLVLCPSMDLLDPPRLYALMRDSGVTCAEFVPAVLRGLLGWLQASGHDLSAMRLVVVGSDVWHAAEYQRLVELCGPQTQVVNSYGTAETTIDSTYYSAGDAAERRALTAAGGHSPVPIGRPFDGTRVYVCDDRMQLVPPGVPGELCIGGAGVSPGYVGAPELNAERFVDDPFAETQRRAARLFRTGDRARYRADGTLVLLGRIDRQLKLRGFRIEPGEIEATLTGLPDIDAAVVDVVGRDDQRRLAAWLVAAKPPVDVQDLRIRLRRLLPDYMVPGLFVELASLPLSGSGKVDRDRLPSPVNRVRTEPQHVEPGSAHSAVLLEIVRDVLDVGHVKMQDSFFDLGGHSLLATQLIARIRDVLDVELPLRSLFEDPTLAAIGRAIDRAIEDRSGAALPPLVRSDYRAEMPAPMSLPQQRLWFLAALEPGSAAYHLHWAVRLTGVLDHTALGRAVDSLVARHAALRTSFRVSDGEPCQWIAAALSGLVRDHPAATDIEALIRQPFDLQTGPLMRVHVVETGPDEQLLLVVVHHIVFDGWSMALLMKELTQAYNAFRRGQVPAWELPGAARAPIRYVDYAAWQRDWLQGDVLESQLQFWRDCLDGAPPVMDLPLDRPRTAGQPQSVAWLRRQLGATLTGSLHALARAERCTLFMVLVAAFNVVLARVTGQTDLVIGTPTAGRGRTELEGLIGFFINTLVLRVSLDGNPTFRELLTRVRETTLNAFAHQEVPFEKLVEVLQPRRDRSLNPLVQVQLALHNQPVNAFSPDGLQVEPVMIENTAAKFDLNVHVAVENDELQIGVGYNPALFDTATIDMLTGFFATTLQSVCGNADIRLNGIGAVPRIAAGQDWSGNLVEQFMTHVRRAPQAIAISTPAGTLTYGALNARANAIAQGLLALPNSAPTQQHPAACVRRIGVYGEYDQGLVAALLGILKAGFAWVPMDPAWPAARCEAIAADAGLSAVCTDAVHAGRAHALFAARWPVLELDLQAAQSALDPAIDIDADALAYIIYTSGSTGKPKGVVQTHRGAVIQAGRYCDSLQLNAQDRLAGLSGYAYDAAIQDIFGALLSGATVCPMPARQSDGRLSDRSVIAAQLNGERISILHASPALFRYLVDNDTADAQDWSAVRAVVLGGEAVYREDFARFVTHFPRGTRFVNGLGLTESTLALQFHADHDTPLTGGAVPVGTGVNGLEVILMDAAGNPSWSGEIVLRGTGLSPGYWADQGDVFGAAGAAGDPATLHTGDFGFRLPDGRIVYTGRGDTRVKIRGFRVEPREIESVLKARPGVIDCAVRARGEGSDTCLAAWLVMAKDRPFDAAQIRAALAQQLPDYMLPQTYDCVAELPRLANGKLDQPALPAPGAVRNADRVAPRNAVEAELLSIWQALLPRRPLGIHDDFFTVGGHSLLATRVVARIRDRFDIELPLAALFDAPTIAGLAGAIEKQRNQDREIPRLVRVARDRYRSS